MTGPMRVRDFARGAVIGWTVTGGIWLVAALLGYFGAVLVAVCLLGLWWYPFACWRFPFRNCWVCKGAGKRRKEGRKTFKLCWWCGGTGGRLRIGRRVFNYFHKVRQAAK